jgi:hypothetical protein
VSKNEIYLQEIYQSSNQEMFAISLSSCSRYNANFKLDQSQCSLFMTVRHIFKISEDDHPRTVSQARDHWWTLDFANAFVSPGVNSRGGLVPSHGASRRRLGDYMDGSDQWHTMYKTLPVIPSTQTDILPQHKLFLCGYAVLHRIGIELENTCMHKPSPCSQNHYIFRTWSI